jgi:hypothetical protein
MNRPTTVAYLPSAGDLRFAIGPECRRFPPGQGAHQMPAQARYHVRRPSCFLDLAEPSSLWKSNKHHPQQRR